MFGPGFVWLVQTNDARRSLRILPTYLAGSPLSGAHYRRQTVDLTTENINSVGAFGAAAKAAKEGRGNTKKALGGVDVVPLMCVNTWEHVWLTDYGIGGKMEYLERWFNKIDWNVVQESATLAPSGRTFDYGGLGLGGSRNKFAA
jgi:Fe-Mn family superoxide dismutase